jgi:predicted dehydrogenase
MRTIRFGIVGCGLMGREFASASARWCHVLDAAARPEIVAVCSRSAGPFAWFKENFPSIAQFTHDYRELLANPDVEAVYVAVPHHLHREIYCAAIEAGRHLMGEKPFGIDRPANEAILACLKAHPEVFARCSSHWAFYPGPQRLATLLERNAFGPIIEVNCGFLHSSDLDPNKPINWKRMIEFNGEYGCLGDLGMHVLHIPLRAGWFPRNVRAVLSDIFQERPDSQGRRVPCRTWDNATLLCEVVDPVSDRLFPMTIKTQRIAPGEKNTWYLEVYGVRGSARYSTREPKRFEFLDYTGGDQSWIHSQTGYETPFKTITGGIFEFGSTDAILQMWAGFLHELVHRLPARKFAGCVTPEEAAFSHRLFTAALESQRQAAVVQV